MLLFNSVGGALLAMTALGVSLAAVPMECNDDDEASQVARSALDEDFRAECMQKMPSGCFTLVLVMGGSPRQVSHLNPSRAGLQSSESLLFKEVFRDAAEVLRRTGIWVS